MADIYTYKSPMGKTTKYLKKGGKYYRIKDNGQLAKEPTTGSLILGNLKNKDSSFVEKVNAKETKRIVSKFTMPDGKANASTVKASVKKDGFTKEDGGKAAFQKKYPESLAKELKREKAALAVVKKDTNNLNTGSSKNKVAKIVTKKQLDDFKNSAAMQKKHGRKALTLRDYRNNELGITKRRKDVSKPSSKERLFPSIFSNQKITQKELMAEIAKEKANPEMKKAKFNQPDKAVTAKSQKSIDAIIAMIKKTQAKQNKKTKMMGGGYSMKKKK